MYAKPILRIVEAPTTAASCTPCQGVNDPQGFCRPTSPPPPNPTAPPNPECEIGPTGSFLYHLLC